MPRTKMTPQEKAERQAVKDYLGALADNAPKMKTYLSELGTLAKSKNPPNVSYQWGNRKYALFGPC